MVRLCCNPEEGLALTLSMSCPRLPLTLVQHTCVWMWQMTPNPTCPNSLPLMITLLLQAPLTLV